MSARAFGRAVLPTALLGLCLVLGGVVSAEPRDGAPASSPSPKEAAGDLSYGNTPPELRPFSRFVKEPYNRFFLEPTPYLGPWRIKDVPDMPTVRLGLLAPLERSHEAYLGRDILEGARLAVEEANKAGGYEGKPFELVVRNDTGLWGASANEVVRFAYDDHVRVIIGTVDGANTHIAIRVALKIEIPVINVGDLDPTLVETRIPWIFRVVPDDRQQAYTLAFYLYKQLGLERVAVVRANNRYGRFGVAEFIRGSVRLSRPTPIEINYDLAWERTAPGFSEQLAKLAEVAPEAVVLWADAKPAGRLVRLMRERGMEVPVFACDRVVHREFLEEAGPAAEGVVAVTPFDLDAKVPGLEAFKARYRARYGHGPSSYSAHAYDGTMMAIQAIQEAGLNWARIRDALAETMEYHGITGDIRFDGALSNRRRVTLATVKGGRFVYGEPKTEFRF